MIIRPKEDIIIEIEQFIKEHSAQFYHMFYIGITNDIDRQLFEEHKVTEKFVYFHTTSKEDAQSVLGHFLTLGMHGKLGNENIDSTCVYCYEMACATNP